MRLDLSGSVGTQPALRIPVQQSREEIPRGGWDNIAAREGERFLQDLAVHLVGVLIVEWRQPRQHLIKQDTQSPPIHRLRVAIAKQEFRREVLGSSTERWIGQQ